MARKMNRTPDGAKHDNKRVFFEKTLSRTSHEKIRWNGTGGVHIKTCVKFVACQHSLAVRANSAPLAVASLQSPCVVQQQTSLPLLQLLLAAEDYAKPLLPREFQSLELLGPRQKGSSPTSHNQLFCRDSQHFRSLSIHHCRSRCR